jgi:mitochondrial fission protein ELM1
MQGDTGQEEVWVLLGTRHGDNQQLLSIASALNVPFRTIALSFNLAATLPPAMLGAGRLSWRSQTPLAAPWPRLLLAAGRKSVPAARWIRRQSLGRTRLVHVNRPWAPLSWFDLVITTPQYALPQRPNVVCNLMPLLPPVSERPPGNALPSGAAELPRPWTVVLVGGSSRPYELSRAAAASLAGVVNARVRELGGTAWVLDSPRTPDAAMTALEQALGVPSHISRWRDGHRLYATLLGVADGFIVTADSASMLTEALLTGRPVTPFKLPVKPDWRWRLAAAWRAAADRKPSSMVARGFAAAVDLGLLSSVRDLGLLHRALEDAGVFGPCGRPLELAARERQATLARVLGLLDADRSAT